VKFSKQYNPHCLKKLFVGNQILEVKPFNVITSREQVKASLFPSCTEAMSEAQKAMRQII
jgi:hypothetical protein